MSAPPLSGHPPLPFAGLGFSLAGVIAYAGALTVREALPGIWTGRAYPRVRVLTPAGYELLVRLGREIRGR